VTTLGTIILKFWESSTKAKTDAIQLVKCRRLLFQVFLLTFGSLLFRNTMFHGYFLGFFYWPVETKG